MTKTTNTRNSDVDASDAYPPGDHELPVSRAQLVETFGEPTSRERPYDFEDGDFDVSEVWAFDNQYGCYAGAIYGIPYGSPWHGYYVTQSLDVLNWVRTKLWKLDREIGVASVGTPDEVEVFEAFLNGEM